VTRRISQPGNPALLVEHLDNALELLAAKAAGEQRGLTTGLGDLDTHLGGLLGGQLVVVGARPSVGKTAFGFGIALHVAIYHGAVVVYSAEMSGLELALRTLATSGVSAELIRSGRLGLSDFGRLAQRRDQLAGVPLVIDDAPGTIATIRESAQRHADIGGLALVVVDYLQLIPTGARSERRELEVAEVSRGLKALARDLAIPVLAVAQLNRAVEFRVQRRPVLADLRDSGQVEQDADVVLLLHRPGLYDLDVDPGATELIIAKHRNGPTGVVELVWLPQRTQFVGVAHRREAVP